MCSRFCQYLALSVADCCYQVVYSIGVCVDGIKSPRHLAPWRRHKNIVVCIIGFGNAGKTTIIKAVQGEDLQNVHSTVGFSRAEMEIKGYKIIVYDLGGEEKIRAIWTNYYAEVYGIVYVVDGTADKPTMEKTRQMLETVSKREDVKGKPFLIFLNKKDLPDSIDELQFSDECKLHALAKEIGAVVRVESVCGVHGIGKEVDPSLIDGFDWLIDQILLKYTEIEKGVQIAVEDLKQRQVQERLERQHRLAVLTAARDQEAIDSPPSTSQESEEEPFPSAAVVEELPKEPEIKEQNGQLVTIVEEIEKNHHDYDPPSRVQRILEQVKKQKSNKIAPMMQEDEFSLKNLEKKAGYNNDAFDDETAAQIPPILPKNNNQINNGDAESNNIKIAKLQPEEKTGTPEKTVITDKDAIGHDWHDVKSI